MTNGSTSASSGVNRMQIEQMQRELAARGLYQGQIDGRAGPQTMAALRQFQQQQGLPTNSGLDEATRQALGVQLDKQPVAGAQTSASPELERTVGREGATPAVTGNRPMRSQVQLDTLNQEQLRVLQTRLQELGFYQGEVDGRFGEGTRNGLRQFFQTQADLASRGVITDATIGVFGVSPQGLNGATPTVPTSSQRGTQPRGNEGRANPAGSVNPRGGTTNPTMDNPTPGNPPAGSSRGTTGSSGSQSGNSGNTSGSTSGSTTSSPSGSSASAPSGTSPR